MTAYKKGSQLMLNDLCGRCLAQVELLLQLMNLQVTPVYAKYLYRKDETDTLNVLLNIETTLLTIYAFASQKNFMGGYLYRIPVVKEGVLENLGAMIESIDVDELNQASVEVLQFTMACFTTNEFYPIHQELSDKILTQHARDEMIKDLLENRQQDALRFVERAQQLAVILDDELKTKANMVPEKSYSSISDTPLIDTEKLSKD
jgi:hypothetical protein